MEELLEIRQLLQQGKINEALLLVDELEEMSLSDKINKIDSYGVILLIHLIKQTFYPFLGTFYRKCSARNQ
jgi:ABC-type transporter Mla MlaB component